MEWINKYIKNLCSPYTLLFTQHCWWPHTHTTTTQTSVRCELKKQKKNQKQINIEQ